MRRVGLRRSFVVVAVATLLLGVSPSTASADQAAPPPSEEGASARAFSDVPPSHPFVGPITWMADEGITGGFPDGTFRPTDAVSRQAMAAFMFRLAGEPDGDWLSSASDFSDVGVAHPFAESIGWMAAAGISGGFPDGTFRPTDAVSRQAMAAFMFRLDGEPEGNWVSAGAGQFPDVGVAHPFAESIGWMALEGISTGFGDNTFRPGDPVSRQAMAAFMQRFADTEKVVAAAGLRTCATAVGAVWCFGTNFLGTGSASGSFVPVRTVGLASGVTQLATHTNHTCALTTDGQVWCWGNNLNGQIGDGTSGTENSPRSVPTEVVGLPGPATEVTVGQNHTCAIVAGAGYCWGSNTEGQLGTGDTDPSATPVQVSGLGSGVTSMAAGQAHTCAVVSGAARCWGFNGSGQLGTGGSGVSVPTQVSGLTSNVEAVFAGSNHSCAIVGGGLQCWGANTDGQLGDNSTTQRPTPVQVTGLTSGVTDAALGTGGNSCAVHNGGLLCWGDNEFGQLGQGGTIDESLTPVAVTGLSAGLSSVSVGADHACASTGRTVWCWGQGGSKLGLGMGAGDQVVPVRVPIG